jgi:S1-C subfamily serine protease
VVEPGDDFDDVHDEDGGTPLLPPDDRLWRHPSELGQHGHPVSVEALTARRSWLAATPSRAGAWSAGIVGAVLATGVVLVGGHLAHLLSPPSARASAAQSVKHPGSQATSATTTTVLLPLASATTVAVQAGLRKLAARVTTAMPVVIDGGATGVGVVVSSKGYVLVPSSLVTDADDIRVVLGGRHLVGSLVGSDSGTGLAVVRVHDIEALTTARFVADEAIGNGSFVALVWVDQDGAHTCLGTVRELDVQLQVSGDNPPLLESLQALDPVPGAAAGGVVMDGAGRVIGMLTRVAGSYIVATPGWLADIVSQDLISTGRVIHGWLGITGETVSVSDTSTAVEVLSVAQGGAAAKAGVEPGDLIKAVNGQPIRTMADIVAALYSMPPNKAISLNVVRRGKTWAARTRLTPAA